MSVNTILLLTIVTYVTICDQVASYSIGSWPISPITIPSPVRSFLWSSSIPVEKVEEMARSQAAETQNKIAQTQKSIAQAQNNISNQVKKVQGDISNQVKKVQDDISKRVNDVDANVVEYVTPGTRRKLIISDEGVTEEVETNYKSPDGRTRGYTKSSVTTFSI